MNQKNKFIYIYMNLEYKDKYLKYKSKYNKLKKQSGGTVIITSNTFRRLALKNININIDDFKPLECAKDNDIILKNKIKIIAISNQVDTLQNLLNNDDFIQKIIEEIDNKKQFDEVLTPIKTRMKICNTLIDEICNLIENFTILCVDCEKNNKLKQFLIVNLIRLKLIQDKLIDVYKKKILEYMTIDEECCKDYKLTAIFKFNEIREFENIIDTTICLKNSQILLLKEKNKKHKEVLQLI